VNVPKWKLFLYQREKSVAGDEPANPTRTGIVSMPASEHEQINPASWSRGFSLGMIINKKMGGIFQHLYNPLPPYSPFLPLYGAQSWARLT